MSKAIEAIEAIKLSLKQAQYQVGLKTARFFMEQAKIHADQALAELAKQPDLEAENERLKTSLKIAINYIKNPRNRTLEGQLKDIETGHY